jgi:hypothetical protein
MGLEAIIATILTTGLNVIPRLIGLIQEWKGLGPDNPTPEQVTAVWKRIQIAEDRIDAAHAARHANDPPEG